MLANIFQPLIDVAEAIVRFYHDTVGLGWGWAIVGLTVTVRLAILPLTFKQVRSMQAMQQLQPQMKELQKRYKDDRQRMNQEMMAFYKENQINPAASCVPMLAQFPVFISLFFVLRNFSKTVSADSTGLGWLHLITITENTKVGWGPLLIILYGASQLTSSYLMSQNMQPAQRAMLLILPIAFIPFVLNFPSGLMLYWLTTNLWTTGQGLITRRLTPKPQPPPKRSSRTPPKDAPPPEPEPDSPKPAAAKPAGNTPQRVRKVKRKKGSRR